MSIYMTGDTHADFKRFGSHFFDNKECYIIVCGDFGGVWDNSNTEKYWLDWLEKKKFTILFVDGNHENFDLLNVFPVTEWNGGKIHVIRKNIIHLMRGQVFTIDGIRFFTFGGGQSHDIQAGILDRSDPDFSSISSIHNGLELWILDFLLFYRGFLCTEQVRMSLLFFVMLWRSAERIRRIRPGGCRL